MSDSRDALASRSFSPQFKAGNRRRIKKLLDQLVVFRPESVAVRWRIIDMILKLLLDKRDRGFPYVLAYIRNKDLVRKIKTASSVDYVVRMLLNFKPPILKPLDKVENPPQIQFTKNGVLILKHETEIWHEIFELTDEYDLLKPSIEIISQRLDEIDRYIQGSDKDETKTQ